jgi:hypothetical protein
VVLEVTVQAESNMNKTQIKQLKENYEKACNDYVAALLTLWDMNDNYGYWIGEDVGGVYDIDGWITINMQEIIYCVENNVTSEEVSEWQDYGVKCAKYHLPILNLNAWHKGAPRHDFTKLDALKKDLDDAIDNEKSKF